MGKKMDKVKNWCKEKSDEIAFAAGLVVSTVIGAVIYDKAYKTRTVKTYENKTEAYAYEEQVYACLNKHLDEHPEDAELLRDPLGKNKKEE